MNREDAKNAKKKEKKDSVFSEKKHSNSHKVPFLGWLQT